MSMMRSMVGTTAIAILACALLLAAGCGPKQPKDKKIKDLPKRPPPVPAAANVPIDPALRASAKEAVLTAFRANDPRVRTNAVEAIEQTFPRPEARQAHGNGVSATRPFQASRARGGGRQPMTMAGIR